MSNIPDYTLVVAVDEHHLRQLELVWPTWRRHKPSLLDRPMVVIYDREQLICRFVRDVIRHPDLLVLPWPPDGIEYEEVEGGDRFQSAQRYKMLSAFVHVPPKVVHTPYWLKLDTDAVATGTDDWIDPEWFADEPVIVSHPWGFTRPPDQMLTLDRWVDECDEELAVLNSRPPLNLQPEPGRDRLDHKRIISWCAFFKTDFVSDCSCWAEKTCGVGKMPVRSQDGYLFYCATRLKLLVVRTQMKRRGWQHWHTMPNVRKYAEEAMR